tara:strand:+ start:21647 stop:22027 length:381 start_codon:yes stop_codon:yes gene_type:complete
MSKQVISDIPDRTVFMQLLANNPGLIIVKLGASWCRPCKTIKPVVDGFFATAPVEVLCCDLDVDESYDLYSLLKSKQMVNGIPVLLCYKKGNLTIIPDDSITGIDPLDLHHFFKRCGNHLQKALSK